MTVSLQFFGAAGGVTGSRYVLEADGKRILVDCGLFQGRRDEARARNLAIPCDGHTIDAAILTHGHIDHSGAIPLLVKCGFRGRIHCTPATLDLTRILLRDSAYIHEKDAEYLNEKKRQAVRRDGGQIEAKDLIQPLYTSEDAEAADSYFEPTGYGEEREILPGVTMRFSDQGHILGSAAALVTVARNGEPPLRVVFSGDRGRKLMPILRDPEPYPECDYILTESTYGDRLHEPVQDLSEDLAQLVREVVKSSGRLVIPAFSVGRTQNILYHLFELRRAGRIPDIDTFVDSPLSSRATKVYADHPECFDDKTLAVFTDPVSPFRHPRLHYIEDVKESIALNQRTKPCIILSASGMCESGRILHHLRHALPDARNIIVLVGFMAENTLGRRLKDGATPVRILDRMYGVRARIVSLPGFSAHGDRNDILASVRPLKGRVRTIFLVHGEGPQAAALKEALKAEGHGKVHIARPLEKVNLN